MKKQLTFLLVLLCATLQGAWAQTWTEVGDANALNTAIADGAYIRLTGNITLSAYLKIGQSGTQSVTIDLGGYTLQRSGLSSASSGGHVIEVFTDGNLTLQNGTLTGGWAENGGGICNFGTLALINVKITKCKATDGGGIHNKAGATLSITGGSITDCSSNAGGGAVVNYGTATISNCELSDNTATTRGGAIWTNSTLTTTDCEISGNVATLNDGGAVHINGGTATLNNARMVNNRSTDAGAIYVSTGAKLNLGGTNTLLKLNTSSEHGGGGIVNQGTTALSGNVTITQNSCATDGAGIWNNGTLKMEGNIQINDNLHGNGKPYTDLFMKKGKVIEVTGRLTGGEGSIHLRMEDFHGLLTSGYSASGTTAIPFAVDNETNKVDVVSGECYQLLGYYDCTWDETNKKVVRTVKWLANDAAIDNLCTGKYASGGGLVGKDYACFVVYGTGSTTHGLQCDPGTNKLIDIILCDNSQLTITGGLHVNMGTTLRIFCQSYGEKMGKLIAEPLVETDAGIGSRKEVQAGTIEIHGGNIKATGGRSAAGIGGGYQATHSYVNIYGGRVEGHGGDGGGAGIGAGAGAVAAKGGTVNIYDGEIYAYGGSGGAGIGDKLATKNTNYKPGTITIHGGRVEAHGGENSAGIGGGYSTDGDDVTINGGKVYAYGGEDAAGIGSGYEDTGYGDKNGGKLTVTGGYVFADGTGWGAGIGGGEDADGTTVEITGGIVEAWAGEDAGKENGSAIGSEEGDGHYGSLKLGDNMMVHAGQNPDDAKANIFAYDLRVTGCRFRPYARIEPCDHQKATYTIDGTTMEGTHTLQCSHCLMHTTEQHTFADGICTICGTGLELTLADAANNREVLDSHDSMKAQKVTLAGRTLYKDGSWNTLCLPFNLNADQIAASDLAGAELMTLGGSSFDTATGALTINFTPATSIEAGKPYIVRWTATEAADITGPTFSSVTIHNSTSNVETDYVDFVGSFSPIGIEEADNTMLYLGASNTLYYPSAAMTIGACRAYFQLKQGLTCGDLSEGDIDGPSNVRAFTLNFGDSEQTGIREINLSDPSTPSNPSNPWYTIDGRRLSGQPTQKGLYINRDRKILIK